MATITNGYSVPSDIYWVDGDVGADSASVSTSSEKKVVSGGSSFKISWACPHYTYQLQYRTRRRLSPPYAATFGYAAGEEAWEEWGEWQGHDLSDVKSDTERLSWGNLNVTSASFDFPYDFSQYDRIEYQVRVRAFDEKTLKCSNWGYGELSVLYEPVAEVASATRQPNGDVLLSVETNWLRGGNKFSLASLRRDENKIGNEVDGSVKLHNLDPDFTATIPASMVGDAKRVYADMRFNTSDSAWFRCFTRQWFDIGENTPPDSIAEPIVTVEDMEPYVFVNVVSEGADYEAVYVTASYTDALGKQEIIEAEAVNGGFLWSAFIDAPPYDVPVTYTVAVVNGDGWTSKSVEHVTESKGRCTWSDEDYAVSLVFDLEVKSSFSLFTEVVDTADGKAVARFGRGGSRALTVEGTLLAPSIADGAWKPALEALRMPRKWVYRKPGGERYKVVVTSVSDSEAKGTIDRVVSASVSMREVS